MASVTGYVQWMYVEPGSEFTKVGIGPTPTDTQLLLVMMESGDTNSEVAMKATLIDAFATALAARREVTADYSSSDSRVSYLEMSRA
jgi:hypothetical protein